jgi:hypothetical protein
MLIIAPQHAVQVKASIKLIPTPLRGAANTGKEIIASARLVKTGRDARWM